MTEYRYTLEPYKGPSTRYRCPECNIKKKTFSRYIDTVTGDYIHPSVGRCNRESNCSYHYTPKQYFHDNNISSDTFLPMNYIKPNNNKLQPNPVSFIDEDVFKASLKNYDVNNFIKYLIDLFGVEITNQLKSLYSIGTSKYWEGGTVFWQKDIAGKIRSGKIMLYNHLTGKRVKIPSDRIYWVHKALKLPTFELKQCLFGEHLLADKIKPVALVESEKTAIIASVYFPQFIWLAVGGINNLNFENCKVLNGRSVTLFPDLKGYENWKNKTTELSQQLPGIRFNISDFFERRATETENKEGLDLADYLVKFNYKEFLNPPDSNLTINPPFDLTPAQAFLEKLNKKNPFLKDLISKLDLDTEQLNLSIND